ncbi:MAG TPA: hypothetical protein VH851_12590 [Candidatus Binatia bacterium]|jgi:hypothetical protein
MFGKGVFQEEENLLRNIIRSIDKRVDYSAKEGEGSRFIVHLKLRANEDDVVLDLEDLQAARTDMVKRHQIRQKIKARTDHLDKSRYEEDILGLKSARLLKASPKPEPMMQRGGFGRGPRR